MGTSWLVHATEIAVGIAVVLIAATIALTLYIGGRRVRAQARERRLALGEPKTTIRGGDEDHVVCLRGRLQTPEGPCPRYEDGGAAAATTLEISAARSWYEPPDIESHSGRRAPELTLLVEGAEVVLEGPVNVWVGSREVWPGTGVELLNGATARVIEAESGFDPRKFDGFPVFRSIDPGEEVIAVGKLVRDRSNEARAAGYREAAAGWRLRPRGAEDIALAAVRPPRFVSRRHLLLAGPSLAVGAALVVYAALVVDFDEELGERTCASRCVSAGLCEPRPVFTFTRTKVICEASDPLPCERMDDCLEEGRCTASKEGCIATSAEQCRAAPPCARWGRCTPEDGRCVVGSNEDCEASAHCRDASACTRVVFENGAAECRIGSTADCKRTFDCKNRGMCTWLEGRCIAASEDDCRGTRYCEEDGLCSFDPARQLCHAADDDDCRSARTCTLRDRCHALHDICQPRHALIGAERGASGAGLQ